LSHRQYSPASFQKFHGFEPVLVGEGVIATVICVSEIGAALMYLGAFFVLCALAWYIYRAKPAKDINLGLKAPTPWGEMSFGVFGNSRPNAKDHPATANSGRSAE